MDDLKKNRKFVFLLFSKTHLLDLSGPAQVFYEANQIGDLGMEIIFASQSPEVISEQNLCLAGLQPIEKLKLTHRDFVLIPGIDFASFARGELHEEIKNIREWLTNQAQSGIKVASICSGSLILAEAGLLKGISCTSHWKCIDFIEQNYPDINIHGDRLFVKDQNIYTSAGMTSGMDMSLAILEELYGPILTSKVAREMVIFLRRNKENSQESVYLDYQTHFNPSIHKVQDYIISHPGKNPGLDTLAEIANMSERNLTRKFKDVTGHTITEFKHEVKLNLAKMYLNNPSFTIETIAEKCGFSDPRQLRRIWKKKIGGRISNYRNTLSQKSQTGLDTGNHPQNGS